MNTTLESFLDELADANPAVRKVVVALERDRQSLRQDQEMLRLQEQNLQEYEARLRSLQAGIAADAVADGAREVAPRAHDDSALQAAWAKLHRARELLDAEEAHLRNDRLAQREPEMAVRAREEAVARREQLAANAAAPAPVASAVPGAEETQNPLVKLTRTPFDFARRMLRPTG